MYDRKTAERTTSEMETAWRKEGEKNRERNGEGFCPTMGASFDIRADGTGLVEATSAASPSPPSLPSQSCSPPASVFPPSLNHAIAPKHFSLSRIALGVVQTRPKLVPRQGCCGRLALLSPAGLTRFVRSARSRRVLCVFEA